MFEALSSNEYVKESISHFVALAPIVQLVNQTSKLLRFVAFFRDILWKTIQNLEFYNFSLFGGDTSNVLLSLFCKKFNTICDLGLHMISDLDPTTDESLDYY